MSQSLASLVQSLLSISKISDADTLALRQQVWPDNILQPAEADMLFQLNTRCKDRCTAWADFFVDALCHYVVHQHEPKGYINDDNAAWLMTHLDRDGRIESFAEIDLLVRILETASNAPDSLKAYAIRQIEQTIYTGTGPTRLYGDVQPGRIDDAEVNLLRRLLFARAGDDNIIVSRPEAELLFRLKDTTLGAENSAQWQTFFVQCIANHLMAHQTYAPISHDEQVRREEWLASSNSGFLGKMFSMSSLLQGLRLWTGLEKTDPQKDQTAVEHDIAVKSSRAITPAEADWLKAKISVDDSVDELEKAVLAFILDETAELPAPLADLQKFA
jgi:hypothetical protein